MSAWRLARSLQQARHELDTARPHRDRASDGTIAGSAHHKANPNSDHEPNAAGVVRAWDVDAGPGLYPDAAHRADVDRLAEHVRQLGAAGFPPLQNGGYVIWQGRIASEHVDAHGRPWQWRPYDGASAHREHAHISVSRDAARYDDEHSWGIAEALSGAQTPAHPAPHPSPDPTPARPSAPHTTPKGEPMPATVKRGDDGREVKVWQGVLYALGRLGADDVIGHFGPRTEAATRQLQKSAGLPVTGAADAPTWRRALGVAQ